MKWGRIFVVGLLFSSIAFSESEISFEFRKNIRHLGEKPEGYELATSLRLPLSFSHSQQRLGVDNGNYFDLAGKLKTALHYRNGQHDWASSLYLSESYSMTPAIENRFVKSDDLFRIETRYLYNILPWLSLYAHGRMETSIFASSDLHEDPKKYEFRDINDQKIGEIVATSVHLDDPFLPITFQENLGVAAAIVEEEYLAWEMKAAVAFRQTLADRQRVFVEEKDKIRIVRDIESFFQIGPLLGTAFNGEVLDGKISYSAGVDTLWPAWQHKKREGRKFLDSLLVEAGTGIAFKLSSWSSLEYHYTAVRIPDILAKFQQNHLVNLNISFDWVYQFGQPQPTTEEAPAQG